jgi:hypothetical protein
MAKSFVCSDPAKLTRDDVVAILSARKVPCSVRNVDRVWCVLRGSDFSTLDEWERSCLVEVEAACAARCPDCGGALSVDPECVISEPVMNPVRGDTTIMRRTRVAAAALCSGCEFAIEIERA